MSTSRTYTTTGRDIRNQARRVWLPLVLCALFVATLLAVPTSALAATAHSLGLEGMHDIYYGTERPPHRFQPANAAWGLMLDPPIAPASLPPLIQERICQTAVQAARAANSSS